MKTIPNGLISLTVLFGLHVHAATYYVDAGRPNDTGAGTTWATAKKTIQAAVNLTTAGDSVIVTNGLYNIGATVVPGYSLSNRVVIAETITVRSVNGPAETIIEGSGTNFFGTAQAMRCVYMTSGVLSGFTLQNGATANIDSSNGNGGGIDMGNTPSSAITTNCIIRNCIASFGGGAYGGTLYNCTLSGNTAINSGGGARNSMLNNCVLTDNNASNGGGSSYDNGGFGGTLNNCILIRNNAKYGGGSSGETLNNCTLSANTALYGGGCVGGNLNNCIVWNNIGTDDWANYYDQGFYDCFYQYSCTFPEPLSGTGNIVQDPAFVDPDYGDFRLRAGSLCIDAGTNDLVVGSTDLAGNTRIQNGVVDMGAYEGIGLEGYAISVRIQGSGTVIKSTPLAEPGGSITFTAIASERAFDCFLTNGVYASSVTPFAWTNIYADGVLTAVFISLSFYVDSTNGNDEADGLSWATAKRTLQSAIDCTLAGDTVWATNGVYAPITTGDRAITIASVNGANATIIDGGTTQRCVTMGPFIRTTLLGFMLRNGYADQGGGVYAGTLRNCTLSNNNASNDGGGSFNSTLDNCTLSNNTATDEGGGAYGGSLTNCILTGNTAVSGGASAYGTLTRCTLSGNSANVGGGSYYGKLHSCLVFDNTATYGGGTALCILRNCTITRNMAMVAGGGVAQEVEVANCIIVDNHVFGAEDNYYWEEGFPFMSYTCTFPAPTGDGNMAVDPLFVNPNKGCFQLSLASPCINAGSNMVASGNTDLAGSVRIVGGAIDMGAFEALPLSMALNNSNLLWSSGGSACWYGQFGSAVDGTGAAQSGPIDDTQNSWLQTSTEGKGTLQFAWHVSSENRDYLRFYVDDAPAGAISGTTVWQTVTFPITNVGPHAFRWEYMKGKSGAAGVDAGWLNQVVWTPMLARISVAASPVEGGNVSGGGINTAGTTITVVASPNTGWRFDRWENNDSNARRIVIVPDIDSTLTAYFVRDVIPLAEALETTTLSWTCNGNANWNGWLLASAHDGQDAAQNGAIGDYGFSSVGTTVIGPGTLTFWWRVSCEEDYDYLDFNLNGNTIDWLTGESGWRHVSRHLDAGEHQLEWVYWKDEADAGGEDAGWLDQFTWTPEAQPLTGFALWAAEKGLLGDMNVQFASDRNGDQIANGFEYAYGSNLTDGVALLNIIMHDGQPVVEITQRAVGTTNDVDVTVEGTTNLSLSKWDMTIAPATHTTGKPEGREWYVPQNDLPTRAFFRLRATHK